MTAYRYSLTRSVPGSAASFRDQGLCWVMLNPSTADDIVDDPTIRRVIRFTRDHGYPRLEVVNLFAIRATRPTDLVTAASLGWDLVGGAPAIRAMIDAFDGAERIVFAWGSTAPREIMRHVADRIMYVRLIAARHNPYPPLCLGVTANGSPRHPLYVPAATLLQPWAPLERTTP